MIYVGTSGFSYDDWVGYFYPEGTAKSRMLSYYASRFNCVEVNSSFYAIPSRRTIESLLRRTPEGFLFSMKANREITHEPSGEIVFLNFQNALMPMKEAGRLGTVLLQFPWSFRPGQESVDYLRKLAEEMSWAPLTVEFRNVGWVKDETFDLLEELGMGFCCVDEPRLKGLMPPIATATSSVGYVRFHGRNAEKWWKHEQAYERYDYLYSEEELSEWLPKIRQLQVEAENLFLFFNNHFQGKAADNAETMTRLLGLGRQIPLEPKLDFGEEYER